MKGVRQISLSQDKNQLFIWIFVLFFFETDEFIESILFGFVEEATRLDSLCIEKIKRTTASRKSRSIIKFPRDTLVTGVLSFQRANLFCQFPHCCAAMLLSMITFCAIHFAIIKAPFLIHHFFSYFKVDF